MSGLSVRTAGAAAMGGTGGGGKDPVAISARRSLGGTGYAEFGTAIGLSGPASYTATCVYIL